MKVIRCPRGMKFKLRAVTGPHARDNQTFATGKLFTSKPLVCQEAMIGQGKLGLWDWAKKSHQFWTCVSRFNAVRLLYQFWCGAVSSMLTHKFDSTRRLVQNLQYNNVFSAIYFRTDPKPDPDPFSPAFHDSLSRFLLGQIFELSLILKIIIKINPPKKYF